MITVIVTYQVKPKFAAQNKQNIAGFLQDFKHLDITAFQYNVYVKEDGVSFVHYSTYRDEAMQKEVLNVPSFKEFQRLRDESGLNNSHKVEVLSYVGSASPVLK